MAKKKNKNKNLIFFLIVGAVLLGVVLFAVQKQQTVGSSAKEKKCFRFTSNNKPVQIKCQPVPTGLNSGRGTGGRGAGADGKKTIKQPKNPKEK